MVKGIGKSLIVNGTIFPCSDRAEGRRLAAMWLSKGTISRHVFKLLWALSMEEADE